MPGSIPGILWIKDRNGQIIEIINQARTAAYLQNADLAMPGISMCDVADFGGCELYGLHPVCGSDEAEALWDEEPLASMLMIPPDEGDWIEDPVAAGDSDLMDWTGDE